MKTLLSLSFLLAASLLAFPQNPNPNFDADLATQLGGDDYGMKSFVLVILKTGSNNTATPEEITELFKGHLQNIHRLVEEKKLIVAGPLGKNDNTYRGIFIFDVSDLTEAEKLLQSDPAVAAKLLEAELYTWYGSAALPTYLENADKIWKSKPGEE